MGPCGGHYAARGVTQTSSKLEETSSAGSTVGDDSAREGASEVTDDETDDEAAGDGVTRSGSRINFDGPAFRQGADQLSEEGREACAKCGAACGLQNLDILQAFWYFLALYFSAQGCAMADRHIRSGDPEAARRKAILKLGFDADAWMRMDSFACIPQTLAKECRHVHKARSAGREESGPIGKWLLLVCMDAYCSSTDLLQCLADLPRTMSFCRIDEAIDTETAAQSLVACLRLATNMRIDVGACFHTYGGRRKTFGKQTPLTQDVAWRSRLLDNLLHVLPLWASPCGAIATAIVALAGRLRGVSPSGDHGPSAPGPRGTDPEMNDLLRAILALPLLGRPSQTDPTKARGYENYFGKIVLCRIWFLLAFVTCEYTDRRCKHRPRHENIRSWCMCPPCDALRDLRNSVTFFGPSPVALFARLRDTSHTGAASLPEAWRHLRMHVERHFYPRVDLLLMQSLPCIWRVYSRHEQRVRDVPLVWAKTRYRLLSALAFESESRDISSMFQKLSEIQGGIDRFEALSPRGQREMLDAFRRTDKDISSQKSYTSKELQPYAAIVRDSARGRT
jgi:hypothetical protein